MQAKIIEHPIVQHKLTLLRDKHLLPSNFRKILEDITCIIFTYATEGLHINTITVDTPFETTKSLILKDRCLVVPILRAGLGMLNPILSFLPDIRVEFIGLERDESTLKPIDYYSNLSEIRSNTPVFILDPMIATGATVSYTINLLKSKGAKRISIITLISTPQALDIIQREHNNVQVFTASVDRELNKKGYILPGLGDAGDRIYGTF